MRAHVRVCVCVCVCACVCTPTPRVGAGGGRKGLQEQSKSDKLQKGRSGGQRGDTQRKKSQEKHLQEKGAGDGNEPYAEKPAKGTSPLRKAWHILIRPPGWTVSPSGRSGWKESCALTHSLLICTHGPRGAPHKFTASSQHFSLTFTRCPGLEG